MPSSSSRLWVVATPIGNSDDISPRGRSILAEVDLVLAEDTRRAARLFADCGIRVRRLTSFFEHNELEKQAEIIKMLENGSQIAIISDAGTPVLCDPGYRLVRACRQKGLAVSPIPGPSAPLAALSCSGIAPIPFTFLGFAPRGVNARATLFSKFVAIPGTLVFFERKDRLAETLEIANSVLGCREVAICRELTKTHEEFIMGSLDHYKDIPTDLLGEITVVIGPPSGENKTLAKDVEQFLLQALAAGLSGRKAASHVKKKCQGWKTDEIYNLLVNLGKFEN